MAKTATNEQRDDLELPAGLSREGTKAWRTICAYLRKHDLTYTGGCKTFYSPAEWRARGEEYGRNAHLIIVYDGGAVRHAATIEGRHNEGLIDALAAIGLFVEECTCWYAAVYDI